MIMTKTRTLQVMDVDGLVGGERKKRIIFLLFNLQLFLGGPVTEPEVRARVEDLAEDVGRHTEEERGEAAPAGEVSVVDGGLH